MTSSAPLVQAQAQAQTPGKLFPLHPLATGSKPESVVQPRLRCTAVTGCREAMPCMGHHWVSTHGPVVARVCFLGLVATGSVPSGPVHCPPRAGGCGRGSGPPRPSQSWWVRMSASAWGGGADRGACQTSSLERGPGFPPPKAGAFTFVESFITAQNKVYLGNVHLRDDVHSAVVWVFS